MRIKARKILDNEGTNRTTCENVQANTSTPSHVKDRAHPKQVTQEGDVQANTSTPSHVKDRAYPKQVTQEGDVYGGMKMIRKDETIFAAYDRAEMRKARIMIVAN